MHWLAIHLPALPLQVYSRALEVETPLAVSQRDRGDKAARILLCNRPAWARGVRPGQSSAGAYALAADLCILERRPGAERAALERLAAWCGGVSSEVSLEPPQALVLEAARSLHLFGGAAALLGRVAAGVKALGFDARCCLAPTPAGGLLLAACGVQGVIADGDALRAALAGLPLARLAARSAALSPAAFDQRLLADLERLGLRRLGELLRLTQTGPRSGLVERLGPAPIRYLEQLLGEAPDPRPRFEPPARYRGRLELPAELTQVEALVFPCRRLLGELAGFLTGRQGGVQRLDWTLQHGEACAKTRFTLGTARPERDPGCWLALLRGRLERLILPAPVRAVALEAADVRPWAPGCLELFPREPPARGRPQTPDPELLDRLRARLGEDAVLGLALAADHRPERAWRWCPPGHSGTGSGRSDRPLWLLPEPLRLAIRNGRPWWDGALDLGRERERIETGWWDGFEVARDYFVATTARGERLWIYRERRGRQGWFLHGAF